MERRPSHTQAAIPCTGLYAMAIGIGGVKVALPAHGAGQLDHSNQRNVSAFFNWLYKRPSRSPITRIFKVMASAFQNRKASGLSRKLIMYGRMQHTCEMNTVS
ncbi:hypothetical protein CUMW_129200 [Citrus unshiu]|nr:hypothetical protein CUMW_129200 [Citrus unshiu]